MARWGSALVRGVAAGLIAGVPQVVLTQVATAFFDVPRAKADIGPRFVRRVTQETLLHWTAALSFSLTTAYVYEWLRHRQDTTPPQSLERPVAS